jgi:hypothetical protein
MKTSIFSLLFIGILALASCDKVSNPYPPNATSTGGLDWSLYPNGDSAHYAANEWPTFTANTNVDRNVLIEDYTGHTCNNCPPAADLADALSNQHPGRVFVASIHTGPTGLGPLQAVQLPDYPTDWTNPQGLAIGSYFGSIPGSAFQGNPRGTISRLQVGGQLTLHPSSWTSTTNSLLTANDLNVNIQSAANYFPSTRGLFLHTEIELLDQSITNNLAVVTYLIEDSIIGDQKMLDNTHNPSYVFRETMRGCIDGKAFGRDLTSADLQNGKYYVNYSYKLPEQYNPDIMHVLIYVYDKVTMEVYQVIKQEVIQ